MAETFEIGAVARACGMPRRRLEGWVEQKVVTPLVRAKGRGRRRRFTSEDALRVGILAAIQRMFGTDFRPGRVAGVLARDLQVPVGPIWRAAMKDDARAPKPGARLVVIGFWAGVKKGLFTDVTWLLPEESLIDKLNRHGPVLFFVDAGAVWKRVEAGLKQANN